MSTLENEHEMFSQLHLAHENAAAFVFGNSFFGAANAAVFAAAAAAAGGGYQEPACTTREVLWELQRRANMLTEHDFVNCINNVDEVETNVKCERDVEFVEHGDGEPRSCPICGLVPRNNRMFFRGQPNGASVLSCENCHIFFRRNLTRPDRHTSGCTMLGFGSSGGSNSSSTMKPKICSLCRWMSCVKCGMTHHRDRKEEAEEPSSSVVDITEQMTTKYENVGDEWQWLQPIHPMLRERVIEKLARAIATTAFHNNYHTQQEDPVQRAKVIENVVFTTTASSKNMYYELLAAELIKCQQQSVECNKFEAGGGMWNFLAATGRPAEKRTTFYENLYACQQRNEFCDVILECDNKSICAHRVVLASAGIDVFSKIFKNSGTEGLDQTTVKIGNKDVNFCGLEAVIKYAYTARVDVTIYNVRDLLQASNFFGVEPMRDQCELFLVGIAVENNAAEMREIAVRYNCFFLADLIGELISSKKDPFEIC